MKKRIQAPLAVLLALGAAMAASSPSGADVPKLGTVGAYGYYASISLFGGPANTSGPSPTVTLPPDGARAPVTTVVPSAKAQFGPATLLESGEVKVSVEPAPGPGGPVTSTASVVGVEEPPVPLLYERVTSTCTARGSELTGSTTLAGELATSTFVAPDPREGEPRDVEPLPANPAPNTERTGEINNVGDRFRVVFNEQIREGDLLTVNAIHMYLLGPIAVGDLVVAQSRCRAGASPGPGGSAPAEQPAVETTLATTAPPASSPALSESAAAADDSSGSVVPLAVGGAVVVLAGVVGATVLRRRRTGTRGTPW